MREKPLYYYAGPDAFVFGSELRALLQHPDVPRTLSLESLARHDPCTRDHAGRRAMELKLTETS